MEPSAPQQAQIAAIQAELTLQKRGNNMIIDMHSHPTFTDFFKKKPSPPPARPANQKLDVIAHPDSMGLAMELTSQQYKGKSSSMLSVKDFKKHLDDAEIDFIIFLCAIIRGQSARENNEKYAKLIKQFDGRAIGFAGFDPTAGEQAVNDIEYALKELGFKGLKMIGSLLGLDINDRAFYPCYEKAQELGVPIMMHTGSGLIMGSRVKHVRPLMVDDVAFDFPGLKIICAHLGCWDYMDVHSMLVRHPNVYSDLSAWALDPRYTSLIPWKLFEQTVSNKIFLGSDYPAAQTPKEALESVRNLPISEEFKKKIIGENAAKFLDL
ncbi:MAG: amidohydrolase family protein [Xanthomonadales bacterium]|nr:amidohydrolase family protein [Xanthomonadales bacterium]